MSGAAEANGQEPVMGAVLLRAGHQLRRRLGSVLVLALLTGLAGGVVLGAVAGARRTETAIRRFVVYNQANDVDVATSPPTVAKLERLPAVVAASAGMGVRTYLGLAPSPDGSGFGYLSPWGTDGHDFNTVNRPYLVAGRLPRLNQPLEVGINELAARHYHLRPGSRFRMYAYSPAQLASATGGGPGGPPLGPTYDFVVVGVERQPADISPVVANQDVDYLGSANLYVTPAFMQAHGRSLAFNGVDLQLHLKPGAGGPALAAAVTPLLGPQDVLVANGSDNLVAAQHAQKAIHVEAIALYLFAGLAALAALLIIGQALARQQMLGGVDQPTLRALGMTNAQLTAVGSVQGAAVGLIGAAVAIAVAVAVSPLMPVGLARQAEIQPGVSLDGTVLGIGFAAVVLTVAARASVTSWRLARGAAVGAALGGGGLPPATARTSRVADAMARAGSPPSAVHGVRMTLEGGAGPTALPTRPALVGAIAAVAGVIAALTFGASLHRLATQPVEQGWNWNVLVGNPNNPNPARTMRLLSANPLVGGFSAMTPIASTPLAIGGSAVNVLSVDPVRGSVFPPLVQGRLPRADDEILLGSRTAADIHRRVGQTVTVSAGARRAAMHIVGLVLMPAGLPNAGDDFGTGAVLTAASTQRLAPDDVGSGTVFAVRYAPGASRAAAFAGLERDFPREVATALPAEEVDNIRRVDGLPPILAGLLALLAIATTGHALVTVVHRKARDLAVLKTLGFERRQVTATVAWQATALAAAGLLVGLPLGLAAGRWAWTLMAHSLSALTPPTVPLVAVLATIPVTLLATNLVAVVPGRSAGHVRPAAVLRTE